VRVRAATEKTEGGKGRSPGPYGAGRSPGPDGTAGCRRAKPCDQWRRNARRRQSFALRHPPESRRPPWPLPWRSSAGHASADGSVPLGLHDGANRFLRAGWKACETVEGWLAVLGRNPSPDLRRTGKNAVTGHPLRFLRPDGPRRGPEIRLPKREGYSSRHLPGRSSCPRCRLLQHLVNECLIGHRPLGRATADIRE